MQKGCVNVHLKKKSVLICVFLLVSLTVFSSHCFASQTRGIGEVAQSVKGSPQNIHLYDYTAALIIGIDRYTNLGPGEQLAFAVKDAKGMEKVLKDNYRFDEIKTLYNEEATKDNIMVALYSFHALSPDAAVFVYYAGHGITMSGGSAGKDLGYLIPYDGFLDPEKMYKNISMQQIKADVCRSINAKHVYFVFDACFAGLMLDTRAAIVKPGRNLAYLQAITGEQVRQVLTAGAKGQTVLDGGPGGHSVFTGRLIQILENVEDYVTAREIGQEITKQVFSDAAARGHDQRPVDGEIYGTGDFVFVPDLEKRSRDISAEVSSLEAEMARLKKLKQDAAKANDAAKHREIERQELIKQAELKQAQIRKQQKEAALKRQQQESIEAEQQTKAREEQEKENEQRLAMLKKQSEKMRLELGSAVSGGVTVEDAVAEMKKIKSRMDVIEDNFTQELKTQSASISQFYDLKISRLIKIEPFDKEFETEADYMARLANADQKSAPVKKEKEQKLAELRSGIETAKSSQVDPLKKQFKDLADKRFTIPASGVTFEFLSYDLKRQEMLGRIEYPNNVSHFKVGIPKQKAKELKKQPDLLVPELKLKATLHGPELDKILFHGPEQQQAYTGVLYNFLGMAFVYIEPDTFMMGSPSSAPYREKDEKQHRVTLTKGYYLQTTEVTQGQWKAVMGTNPSKFSNCGDDCPVETVSWNDIQDFIRKLKQQEGGSKYRLPTESEWEYACRAGSTTAYCFGGSKGDLGSYVWYDTNSGSRTHPVGQKQPNAWGLYDMHGNVWEWCSDRYGDYASGTVTDPEGPSSGDSRVFRGGSWYDYARNCRSANRDWYSPGERSRSLGFRLVLSPGQQSR